MKIKQIIGILGALFVTQSAMANITVHSFSLKEGQTCDSFAGDWKGTGTVKTTVVVPITCHYQGDALVTPTDSSGNYNVHVVLDKTSGICPDHEILDLPGSCHGNVVELQTDSANLHGSLDSSGRDANLAGTVKFPIAGSTVTAEISDMKLKKQ